MAYSKNFKENIIVWAYGLWLKKKNSKKNHVEEDKGRDDNDGWNVGREMEDRHINCVQHLDVFYGIRS